MNDKGRFKYTILGTCCKIIYPCGTGQLTFSLCDNVGYWEASDFSEKMIEETKKRNKKEIVKFSVQDATNLTYTNE